MPFRQFEDVVRRASDRAQTGLPLIGRDRVSFFARYAGGNEDPPTDTIRARNRESRLRRRDAGRRPQNFKKFKYIIHVRSRVSFPM